ncbi:MAG: response regulator [Rhodospirillaceae bacterium]|jgi:two-component system, chemotaxis family, chemotaxis protein CheY|nr:response regulator [Rhodospirillaceae bacterium]
MGTDKPAKYCLVVDDAGPVRVVARRILEGFGMSVREAADGRAALEACRSAMPDAILLDWNMPALDGLGFMQRLRASDGGEGPRVVFCTTRSEVSDIECALAAGADEYIIKPFDIRVLNQKFRSLGLIEPV